jgi:hypothetical protein
MTVRLAVAVSGTGIQPAAKVNSCGTTSSIQITMSSTGTVQLQGSIDGVTFYNVGAAITTSGLTANVQLYPFMRANITANAGTISVFVDAARG